MMSLTVVAMLESQLWDYDQLSANDRVGTVFLRFSDIQAVPIKPTWFNIYGERAQWLGVCRTSRTSCVSHVVSVFDCNRCP